jgi:EAL domain-containing protein (putative c-di-GMP-specific phosphodiesterase class I)
VIEESGLVPVFQPIVDIGCSRVVGVEALARFDTTPRRGPEEWFAEADAVGMLSDLELAAVRAALPSLEELPPDCYLSVNISPGTACSPDLGEELRSTSLDRVVLEVTEHLPVEDYAVLGVALESLRSRGLRLAIDDVGAGFSSLRHIVHLGPDLLKLDVSLIRDLDRDDVRRAVVEALTSFAARIGANVIAEGIETTAELAALQDIGVGFGQGYFLGRPGALVDALMNHSGNEPVAANAARGSS